MLWKETRLVAHGVLEKWDQCMFLLQTGGIDSFSCSADVELTVITSASVFVASMSVEVLGLVREVENPNACLKICFTITEISLKLKQSVQ